MFGSKTKKPLYTVSISEREQPNMNEYQKNLNLLQQLVKLSKDDLWKISHRDVPKNGLKNKYEI